MKRKQGTSRGENAEEVAPRRSERLRSKHANSAAASTSSASANILPSTPISGQKETIPNKIPSLVPTSIHQGKANAPSRLGPPHPPPPPPPPPAIAPAEEELNEASDEEAEEDLEKIMKLQFPCVSFRHLDQLSQLSTLHSLSIVFCHFQNESRSAPYYASIDEIEATMAKLLPGNPTLAAHYAICTDSVEMLLSHVFARNYSVEELQQICSALYNCIFKSKPPESYVAYAYDSEVREDYDFSFRRLHKQIWNLRLKNKNVVVFYWILLLLMYDYIDIWSYYQQLGAHEFFEPGSFGAAFSVFADDWDPDLDESSIYWICDEEILMRKRWGSLYIRDKIGEPPTDTSHWALFPKESWDPQSNTTPESFIPPLFGACASNLLFFLANNRPTATRTEGTEELDLRCSIFEHFFGAAVAAHVFEDNVAICVRSIAWGLLVRDNPPRWTVRTTAATHPLLLKFMKAPQLQFLYFEGLIKDAENRIDNLFQRNSMSYSSKDEVKKFMSLIRESELLPRCSPETLQRIADSLDCTLPYEELHDVRRDFLLGRMFPEDEGAQPFFISLIKRNSKFAEIGLEAAEFAIFEDLYPGSTRKKLEGNPLYFGPWQSLEIAAISASFLMQIDSEKYGSSLDRIFESIQVVGKTTNEDNNVAIHIGKIARLLKSTKLMISFHNDKDALRFLKVILAHQNCVLSAFEVTKTDQKEFQELIAQTREAAKLFVESVVRYKSCSVETAGDELMAVIPDNMKHLIQ